MHESICTYEAYNYTLFIEIICLVTIYTYPHLTHTHNALCPRDYDEQASDAYSDLHVKY